MIVSCTFPVQQCFLMSYFSILALSGGNVFELCVPQCIFSCISWAVCSLVLPASNSPSTEANTSFSKSALQGVKGAVHCTSWAEPVWVSICNVRLLLKLTGLRCCTSANLLCCPLLPQLWVGTDRGQSCLWVALTLINFPSSSAPLGSSESTMAATPAEFGAWVSQRLLCVDASFLKSPFST